MMCGSLDRIFPGIPAPFPELAGKFTDFGQNLQKWVLESEKFADKFPEAGNFHFPQIPMFLESSSNSNSPAACRG